MQASPSTARRALPAWSRGLRRALSWLVLLVMVAMLVDTWILGGLMVPVVVSSGSMAPSLRGPHRQWQCAACEASFTCGLESLPSAESPVWCPNCGTELAMEAGAVASGDRVLVDRTAFYWSEPKRWQRVVFRCLEEPSKLCVKRLVGLPGETVEIRGGDVWIDGQLESKPLWAQRSLASRVYRATASDARWKSETPGAWRQDAARWVHPWRRPSTQKLFSHASRSQEPVDWLRYEHRQTWANDLLERTADILDSSAYDPSESRVLNPVRDLILRCRTRAQGAGDVFLSLAFDNLEVQLRVNASTGNGELVHDGQRHGLLLKEHPLRDWTPLELTLAEGVVRIAVDGDVQEFDFRTPYKQPLGSPRLSIGARQVNVELADLEILRDVFYTPGPGGMAKYQLGADEYFLLGDNSPHALDSRVWSAAGGVRRDQLIGGVLFR